LNIKELITMHLSECVDLLSTSNTFTDPSFGSCLYSWSFKTTTEFYGWDVDRLHLNQLFGFLCWSYTFAGIMMFFLRPSWSRSKSSNFPYVLFACLLAFVQGPLSFTADYLSMTDDTFIHVIDRFMAMVNLAIQSWKVATLFYHARSGTFFCQLCAIIFAAFSFMNSQDAQQAHDPEGFIFWHNMWHIYPFIVFFIECFDFLYLGDYDAMTMTAHQKADENHVEDLLANWNLQHALKTFKLSRVLSIVSEDGMDATHNKNL